LLWEFAGDFLQDFNKYSVLKRKDKIVKFLQKEAQMFNNNT